MTGLNQIYQKGLEMSTTVFCKLMTFYLQWTILDPKKIVDMFLKYRGNLSDLQRGSLEPWLGTTGLQ